MPFGAALETMRCEMVRAPGLQSKIPMIAARSNDGNNAPTKRSRCTEPTPASVSDPRPVASTSAIPDADFGRASGGGGNSRARGRLKPTRTTTQLLCVFGGRRVLHGEAARARFSNEISGGGGAAVRLQ